jgi:effector-binding domain-containing protein
LGDDTGETMIIMKIQVNQYKPEYYEHKNIKKDIEKIFDFRQHGRSYHQVWKVAREDYGLIERRLVVKENEDDLITYYHTTFWKDAWDMEQFWDKYISAYAGILKKNGFKVKIKIKEVTDDRLIEN